MKKAIIFLLLFFICFNVKAIDINSKNAVLINLNTDSIVYEKSKDEKVSVASLQKILTAIVAIENIDNLNEKVIIDRSKVSSIASDVYTIGLKDNEEITYYDLLETTLLKSAGDSALYLALLVSDSEEEFSKLVNDKAKEIGLKNTVYKDPIGLEKDGQYSTAYDISKALEYSLKNKNFKDIFTTSKYKTTDDAFEFSGPREIAKDMEASYIKGAKTGYTSKAGNCLASYIKSGKEEFILVTLNARENKMSHFNDQKNIMDYYLNNYELKKVLKKNDKITTIKSNFGEEIDLVSDEDVNLYIKKDSKIEYNYDGLEKVSYKNRNGDILGKYNILVDGNKVYEKDIYLDKKISLYIPIKYRYILGCLIGIVLFLFVVRKIKK